MWHSCHSCTRSCALLCISRAACTPCIQLATCCFWNKQTTEPPGAPCVRIHFISCYQKCCRRQVPERPATAACKGDASALHCIGRMREAGACSGQVRPCGHQQRSDHPWQSQHAPARAAEGRCTSGHSPAAVHADRRLLVAGFNYSARVPVDWQPHAEARPRTLPQASTCCGTTRCSQEPAPGTCAAGTARAHACGSCVRSAARCNPANAGTLRQHLPRSRRVARGCPCMAPHCECPSGCPLECHVLAF
jgi:hypothetical protein